MRRVLVSRSENLSDYVDVFPGPQSQQTPPELLLRERQERAPGRELRSPPPSAQRHGHRGARGGQAPPGGGHGWAHF